ncbi:MAG: AraC family transcriptional regulator [Pseudomonadota bacterium]
MTYPLTASVDLLNILLNYASQLEIDEQTIISGCGVDLSVYKFNEARIPIQPFHLVWTFILNRADDPDFGLHFGEYTQKLLSRHLIFAMMMNCENAEQAIRKNFQYHNLIMNMIRPVMKIEKTMACLTWEMNHPSLPFERHFSESILTLFVSMLRTLTEDQFRLKAVRFTHSCPESTSEHERIFQAPLEFGFKHNEIVFPRNYLNAPIFLANSKIFKGLEHLVQKTLHRVYALHSWSEKVAQILFKELLKEKSIDIDTVAGHLAMTTRNLQLKLKAENTSFRKLFDEVRKEIALSYLEDVNASICEIALLLDFSDQSAFHHAFKRWTGKTPGEYRKNLRNKPS